MYLYSLLGLIDVVYTSFHLYPFERLITSVYYIIANTQTEDDQVKNNLSKITNKDFFMWDKFNNKLICKIFE